MKMRPKICGLLAIAIVGVASPYRAAAEVSDEDFKALKDAVQQLRRIRKPTRRINRKSRSSNSRSGRPKRPPIKRKRKPEAPLG
jgi:hypothetical protein